MESSTDKLFVFRYRQMFSGFSQLLTTSEHCFFFLKCAQRFDYHELGSSRRRGGADENLIAKNAFVGRALTFWVRVSLQGAVKSCRDISWAIPLLNQERIKPLLLGPINEQSDPVRKWEKGLQIGTATSQIRYWGGCWECRSCGFDQFSVFALKNCGFSVLVSCAIRGFSLIAGVIALVLKIRRS